jgi:ABC-2 type transport system ATP-binding protein
MIEAEKLTKYYDATAAIEDVSFTVEKGETVGFLGPNGAGKTTTMRILAGLLVPSGGTAKVAGYDVLTSSLQVRRRIGYLPETVPLYTDMRVGTYLDFVAEVKGVGRGERKRRVAEIMDRCRIADVQRALIGSLSRGYRQRVGLAQALLNDPEVLILDEPTVGLDPKQIIEIRQLIKDLSGHTTTILSTHILPEASMVCQRVIIINDGRIVAVDTPEHLTERVQHSARFVLSAEGPRSEVEAALSQFPGVLRVEAKDGAGGDVATFVVESERGRDLRRAASRMIVERGWGLLELRPADMTLEEIFIRLVTREEQEATP